MLGSQATRRALHYLRELVTVHRVAPSQVADLEWDAAHRMFATGQAAMALGGSYEAVNIGEVSGWEGTELAARVGCVLPPAAPGGRQVPTLGGTSYAMTRQCERPNLVSDLLEVALDPLVVGDLYRSLMAASPHWDYRGNAGVVMRALSEVTLRGLSAARARPRFLDYFKVSRQLQTMFELALSSTMPIEDIVQQTAQFISVISERPCQPA
jgi:hypothetical protein